MATSTVARSMASFWSMAMLVLTMAYAQSVAPTNASLSTDERTFTNILKLSATPGFISPTYTIAPLTPNVGKGQSQAAARQISFSGVAKLTSSTLNLSNTDMAFIACDPDGSNISAADIILKVKAVVPKAIILYSKLQDACNLTGDFGYTTIFTMTSNEETLDMLDLFAQVPSAAVNTPIMAQLGNTTSGGSGTSNNNDGSPAPTTAVAMSILYSITGIITLLFLIIIATGAVRAHRHPERYGPRNGYSGRPRQSRAKGLARAMLETLPIVKFGDPEPVKPGSRDLELEDGKAAVAHKSPTEASPQPVSTTTTTPETAQSAAAAEATVASGMGAAEAESVKEPTAEAAASVKEGELGCSICTEDFTTGEDVRVLPCQHKYHPACIDPWLLNVSGTCPLCRHDLRPDAAADSSNATDDLPPPLEGVSPTTTSGEATDDAAATQRSRRSRFLDLNRLRHAPPDERIAALRQLREQSRTEGVTVEDAEEQQSRRARLTGRLRDTFRIRTRTQNQPPTQ